MDAAYDNCTNCTFYIHTHSHTNTNGRPFAKIVYKSSRYYSQTMRISFYEYFGLQWNITLPLSPRFCHVVPLFFVHFLSPAEQIDYSVLLLSQIILLIVSFC